MKILSISRGERGEEKGGINKNDHCYCYDNENNIVLGSDDA